MFDLDTFIFVYGICTMFWNWAFPVSGRAEVNRRLAILNGVAASWNGWPVLILCLRQIPCKTGQLSTIQSFPLRDFRIYYILSCFIEQYSLCKVYWHQCISVMDLHMDFFLDIDSKILDNIITVFLCISESF